MTSSHATFQKEHEAQDAEHLAGHWHAFLEALADLDLALVCTCCQMLRSRCVVGTNRQEVQAIQEDSYAEQMALVPLPAEERPLGPRIRTAGRPRRAKGRKTVGISTSSSPRSGRASTCKPVPPFRLRASTGVSHASEK